MTEVEIIVSDEVSDIFPVRQESVGAFAENVITSSGIESYDVNVVFIGNAKMTELNEGYKKRQGATDVLSFNLSEENADILEGEVYISLERALEQASECGVSGEEEIIRLVTHGLLHLAGRTHKTDGDMQSMTAETETIVRNFVENGDVS